MLKKLKENDLNLYYINNGQDILDEKEENNKKKKSKDRTKRINKGKEKSENKFDLDTETVIKMTNKNNLKKQNVEKRKLSKLEQKRKRRNKKIKFFLKVLFLIAIIIAGVIFAMTSPMFNIKEIKVSNNNKVSYDTILSLSGLNIDENIFKINIFNVEKNIKENSYIENIKINILLPNTVQIEVEERIPQYSVDFMGKYVYINNQGYVLEIAEDKAGLVIIQGATTEEDKFTLNNRLNNEDLERLEDVIKIMSVAKENSIDAKITSINVSNKEDYIVYIEEAGKKIYIGDNKNLANKILYAVAIMEQEKEHLGDIFVNGNLNDKFQPYFRESFN